MDVLSDLSGSAVVRLESFESAVEVWLLLLAIEELGLEVPELDALDGRAEAEYKESPELPFEDLCYTYVVIAWIVREAFAEALLHRH